jgi:hypothetical protein
VICTEINQKTKKLISMKSKFLTAVLFLFSSLFFGAYGQTKPSDSTENLFIDVHQLEPGKVKFADVAAAHLRDLAVENKYGVRLLRYWVDEEKGMVYCLSSAKDSNAIRQTHQEAHGLLPDYTLAVTDGPEVLTKGNKTLFLDIHQLGEGNVTAAAVAGAHEKDLAVQQKHGVSFINYWVDEKAGVVMCLSEAGKADDVVQTHKEAHGLLPTEIRAVKQGK